MSTKLELIITGDSSDATQAIDALQRAGATAASLLEREFNQLGIQSALAFENQRKAADNAFQKIKTSGVATAHELQRAQEAYAATLARIDKAEGLHTTRLEEVDLAQKRVGASTQSLSSAYSTLAGVMAAMGVQRFVSQMVDAKVAIDRIDASLNTTFGQAAGAEFQFVAREADRLNLSLTGTAESYASFAAATKGSALEGEKTRAIFTGIVEASTALGRSAYDTAGMINALQQMVSKGNVQAEELRGQLGERLPGAFSLAAKAMGVTEQQLNKMLERGEVLASDLLPRLAAALHEKYGQAAKDAADKMQGALNEAGNAWDALLRKSGDSAPLIGTVNATTAAVKLLTENLDVAVAGMTALTAGAVITNLGTLATLMKAAAGSAALMSAGVAGLVGLVGGGAYLAARELLKVGDDALFDGKLGYGEKKLKEAQRYAEEIRKIKEKSDAATAAAMSVGPAGLGSDALAKLREEQEKQHAKAVKSGEDALKSYSAALKDVGREQMRQAESGFARDMERQAEYFERTATAASNLTAPIQSYLAVIDQVYGAQKKGQEDILATLVQIGATEAARLQQEINVSAAEKTLLEGRRKAWETYAGDVEKLVGTAWDNLAKKEEVLLQSRLAAQAIKDELGAIANPKLEKDPFTARLDQQDALREMERKALATTNPEEKLRLLDAVVKGWAALKTEVKDGDTVLISTQDAAATALDNVNRVNQEIDALRVKQTEQAAEQVQNLTMVKGEAEAAIKALNAQLIDLDTKLATMALKTITVEAKDQATSEINTIQQALEKLKDKTVTITTRYVNNIPGRGSQGQSQGNGGDAGGGSSKGGGDAGGGDGGGDGGGGSGSDASSSQSLAAGPTPRSREFIPKTKTPATSGSGQPKPAGSASQVIQFTGPISFAFPNVTNVNDVRELVPEIARLLRERYRISMTG
jgi:tape measure domain-containing protein